MRQGQATIGQRLAQARLHEYAVVFVLLAMALYLSATTENFLTFLNLSNVLQQVSTIGIIAVGMTVLLVTGNFDLSIGGIAALVGVACVAAINTYGLVPGLLIGFGIGILLGVINGIAVVWFHVNSLVATLGSGLAFTGIAYVVTGSAPVPAEDDGLQRIMTASLLTIPIPVIIFAAMVALFAYLLHFSVFGRQCYAVGANAEAARFAGVRVALVQFVPFVLVGFLAGLAGIVLAGLLNSGQPSAAQSWPLGVIAAVVIGGVSISGGRGTIFQAVVGVLLIGLIDNGFNLLDFDPNYRNIFTGTIIVVAVALDSALRRRAQRRTRMSVVSRVREAPASRTPEGAAAEEE
jgi:ribose/xylose/arabinose/galactoside ABC-type transport system permease subunit